MTAFRRTLPCFFLAIATSLQAAEPIEQHNSNAVWFENWIGLSDASMRVASPDGDMTEVFAEKGTPVFQLSGSTVVDGVYRYELRATTEELIKNRDYSEDGPNNDDREYVAKPFYIIGHFIVKRGVIVNHEEVEEED